MLTLDDFQRAPATLEGWAIFECDGSENGPYQLCRIDDQDDPAGVQPESDDHAWLAVTGRARDGSSYHQRCLDLIAELNPQERESIRKFTGY